MPPPMKRLPKPGDKGLQNKPGKVEATQETKLMPKQTSAPIQDKIPTPAPNKHPAPVKPATPAPNKPPAPAPAPVPVQSPIPAPAPAQTTSLSNDQRKPVPLKKLSSTPGVEPKRDKSPTDSSSMLSEQEERLSRLDSKKKRFSMIAEPEILPFKSVSSEIIEIRRPSEESNTKKQGICERILNICFPPKRQSLRQVQRASRINAQRTSQTLSNNKKTQRPSY